MGALESRRQEGNWRQEERADRKQDSQGGRKREKLRKISQYCITFYRRGGNYYRREWETGVKGTEGQVLQTSLYPSIRLELVPVSVA